MGVKQGLFRALRWGEQHLPGLFWCPPKTQISRRGESWPSLGHTCPWVQAPVHSPEVACSESAVSNGE